MVDHIIDKKPIKLYPINNNYNYTFLENFNEYYDTQSIYDLLNYTKLNNLLYTIYLNWYNLKDKLENNLKDKLENNLSDKLENNLNNKPNNIIYYKYDCKPHEFDKILKNFIDNEYSISIFTINNIIKYYL